MRKLFLALAFLLLPISVCHASSTVTASARQYTAANSESHSITDAAQTNLDPAGNTDFYIATWVYMDTKPSAQSFVAKYDFNSDQRCYRLEHAGGATDRFLFRVSSDGTSTNLFTATADTFGAPALATWYFVQAYHDSVNDVIAVSVNNGTFDTTANTLGVADKPVPFFIGNNSNAQPASGRIGPTLFTLGIPTAAERTALYNAGSGVLYKDRPTFSSATLVSWWDGAETSGVRIDATGTNTLTDNNTVTSAAGKVTYTAEDASQFTAANSESLTIANASAGDFLFGDVSFSTSIWAYFDTNPANSVLIGLDNPTGSQRSWRIDMVSGVPRVILCPAGTTTGRTILNSTYTCPTGVWHMITVTYNATTDALRINVNDTTNTTGSHANGMFATSTANFSIGSESGNTAYLNGRATHASVWSRDLSDAEITQLYNRGFGLDYSDYDAGLKTSLISHWGLKEASGTRYDSVVASANDLTDNNTVTGAAGVVYDAPAVSTRGRVIMISNARLVEDPVYA